jgi:ABC-type transport system involved in multi-copper enzyme maturation permease subunit
MIGRVVFFELLRSTRRGWHHWILTVYVSWLLLVVGVLVVLRAASQWFLSKGPLPSLEFVAWSGDAAFALIGQSLLLLVLVTPAFAAGSLCDEKGRGTLAELLTTGLTSWEIIAGKVLAQVVQLGTLWLAALPLIAFFGVFAGLDVLDLALLVVGTAMLIVAVSAASLLAAVWCRRTSTAVLCVYAAAGVSVGAGLLLGLHLYYDALYRQYGNVRLTIAPGTPDPRAIHAAVAWLILTGTCLALATWRLRPAFRRQLEAASGRGGNLRDFVRRPAVGNQPLRWKERHLGARPGLPLLPWLPRTWLVAAVALVTFGVGVFIVGERITSTGQDWRILEHLTAGEYGRVMGLIVRARPDPELFIAGAVWVLLLASLGVGVRCAGVVSSERERRTWDVLLTTPLESRQLLRGKLWGVIDAARPYLFAYLIAAAPLALFAGVWAAVWVVFLWAATWPLMYFTGATGIWCSVRSLTSWRSLLATLVANLWIILPRYVMLGMPAGLVVVGLLGTFGYRFAVRSAHYLVFAYVATSLGFTVFWLIGEAEFQLTQAEQWILEHERVTPWSVTLRKRDQATRQRR